MKKLILTLAFVFCLGAASFTQPNNGGLFQRGSESAEQPARGLFVLTDVSDENTIEYDGDIEYTPINSGILLLTGMAAAYTLCKKAKS